MSERSSKRPHTTATTGACIESVNINPDGGAPKYPVERIEVTLDRVVGDRHNDTADHGGPSRAVSLYSADLIAALADEGHPVEPGSLGENLTIRGLPWDEIGVGDRIVAGEVVLQVTGYASPCHKIAASFRDGRVARVSQNVHPGWSRLYARVLEGGAIHRGDQVILLETDGGDR